MRNLAMILLITSFLMVPAVGQVQLQADESLVLYLSFDEGEGEIAKDPSQYGNDGIIKGSTEWVSGKFSKALRFDGATGYIEVPHSDSLNMFASLSLKLRFRRRFIYRRKLGLSRRCIKRAKCC